MGDIPVKPTESELALLNLLWSKGPCSVRQLHEALYEQKQVVYTTILKTLQNMHDKGMVSRISSGRGHQYSAIVAQGDVQAEMTRELLDNVFMGDTSALVIKALGHQRPSRDELAAIKRLLENYENNQP